MNQEIVDYNNAQTGEAKEICELLAQIIAENFQEAENKVWHRHPVWFLEGNPIVGYSKLKDSVQLLFWSGQSFDEPGLENEGSYKASQKRYTSLDQVDKGELVKWLAKSKNIQWDYKNIVKKRGVLDRLK